MNKITIENRIISQDSPTYFIADIAANHDGDIERAKDLIYLCAEAGADAAKFQHFSAKTIVSDKGFKDFKSQLSHQSQWEKSVFEVYEDASVDLEWTEELVKTCKDAGIPFITTPYSLEIVDYMSSYVPAYKIGSGDITWKDMLEKVSQAGKPYIMATGASSFDEVVRAVETVLPYNKEMCLMQCNTNYTGSLENFRYIQLNVLKTYKEMFPNLLLGLSDHTPGHATVLGSVALGARMIEKHFTDNMKRKGPDHPFSMDPNSWREMVDRTRELEFALGTGVKRVEKNESDTVVVQRRGMRARRKINAGETICKEDFIPLRPCENDDVNPYLFEEIIGKTVLNDIDSDQALKKSNVL